MLPSSHCLVPPKLPCSGRQWHTEAEQLVTALRQHRASMLALRPQPVSTQLGQWNWWEAGWGSWSPGWNFQGAPFLKGIC